MVRENPGRRQGCEEENYRDILATWGGNEGIFRASVLPAAHATFLAGLAVLYVRHTGARWPGCEEACSTMLETMASCVECLWAVGCEREGHTVEMSWELIERMTE